MATAVELSPTVRVSPRKTTVADNFTTALIESLPDAEPGFSVVLRNLNWGHYRRILEARDRYRRGARITFDRGSLEFMTVTSIHEQWKKLLAMLVECLAEEMGHALVPVGNVTVSRQDLDRGFEPDECYYLQNASRVLPLHPLDFSRDPPPDLAIEIEYTRSVVERLPIYGAVGVPEVWRYDGQTLSVLRLQPDKTYIPVDGSPTFPGVPLAELTRVLSFVGTRDSASIIREFRIWVKTLLVAPPTNP